MKEMLSIFEGRKVALESKLTNLSAQVDQKLSHSKRELLENIDKIRKEFMNLMKSSVDQEVKDMKQTGEVFYNFDQMLKDIKTQRAEEHRGMNEIIHQVTNDEKIVCQKEEATRKLLLGQINYLKENIKLEIESRKKSDEDIQMALDKYKELIQTKILEKRNDIKKREW